MTPLPASTSAGSASTSTGRPRAPRGRLLVVGQGVNSDLLSRHLSRSPLHAPNLFSAIGEVTIAPAGEPITTVIIAADRIDDSTARAAEALRRVDPSLRIVLATLVPNPPSRADLAARGFDQWFALPLRLEDIQRLLTDDDLSAGMESAAPTIEVMPSAPPAPVPPKVVEIEPASKPPLVIEEAAESSAEEWFPSAQEQQQAEHRAAVIEPPTPAGAAISDSLGDTDLVEALLYNPEGVRNLALQLIIQHTQWTDLAIAETVPPSTAPGNERPAPGTPSSVEVLFNDRRFGHLTSAMAGVEQLAPWASWLARWLALDQSHHAFRMMSYQDDLTGAWNRRFFDVFLRESIATAARLRRPVTVMVFDIDNFKTYNDQYGHEAGDDILRETVRVLNAIIRQGDRVCRIGGDEFAVIFADVEGPRQPGSHHPESVDVLARRFQEQICAMRFPKLSVEAHGTLSISGGLATFPWDGSDPEALLRHADQLALESKRNGKNAVTLGPGAQSVCNRQHPQGD